MDGQCTRYEAYLIGDHSILRRDGHDQRSNSDVRVCKSICYTARCSYTEFSQGFRANFNYNLHYIHTEVIDISESM
jgi:hypothetical protein